LTMVGLMSAGPVAYAASDSQSGREVPAQGLKEWRSMTPEQRAATQTQYSQQGPMAGFNLTPEQEKALAAEQNGPGMNMTMMEQMKAKAQSLDATIAKPGTTRADVNGLIAEISKLQTQMFSQRVDHLFAMKKILTPEQFAKLLEMNKNPGQMNQPQMKRGA
jgi:Spy/CpxP family protein refolding chaperone